MLVTEDGIVICVRDEHPAKLESPIDIREEVILISANDEHP